MFITPVSESIIGIDILRNWQYPHSGSLTYGMWAITVERAKWRPLKILFPAEVLSPMQY